MVPTFQYESGDILLSLELIAKRLHRFDPSLADLDHAIIMGGGGR